MVLPLYYVYIGLGEYDYIKVCDFITWVINANMSKKEAVCIPSTNITEALFRYLEKVLLKMFGNSNKPITIKIFFKDGEAFNCFELSLQWACVSYIHFSVGSFF